MLLLLSANNKHLKIKYLRIKIKKVPNVYPMGWEKSLVESACGVTYKKLPSEKGIIVQNISTIYAIYEALKYNKPLVERVVTLLPNFVFFRSGK